MSRAALKLLAAAALAFALPGTFATEDPHLDLSVVEGGCAACHAGHGASRSPMLPAPQKEVCLSCHGSQGTTDAQIGRGVLAPGARPQFLSSVLAQPFTHPLTAGVFSRRQEGAVTCTSCHTPHRSTRKLPPGERGQRRLSTRDPTRFEFELCQSCHGAAGTATQSFLDVSRLTNPNNRSYHPIEAPAAESSPSIRPDLRGLEINCTDCHGNSDPAGPRGPHGSEHRYLVRERYDTVDGNAESPRAYALCYRCHLREEVLGFPLHEQHVVERNASCATCHSAHGSVDNRALIRFGEETFVAGVSPSISTGRLEFRSDAAGSGLCFLTCHGVDHAPEGYGLLGSDLAVPWPGALPRQ